MTTEKVKVYEEKEKKGTPVWMWLLPLLALLLLAFWLFTRHPKDTATSTAAAPVADQTKPDASAPSTAWTSASIADSIRSKGRVSFSDNDVHFATASASLAGDSQAVLDQTAQALKENGDWRMRIVGHTDSTGSASSNAALAEQRASTVMTYLTAHGIDQSRLSVDAKAAAEPVATNGTDTGRAENRRVDLIKQ